MNKRDLLVEKLLTKVVCGCYEHKVGVVIDKLRGEDAEVVKTLTSEDFDHRIK